MNVTQHIICKGAGVGGGRLIIISEARIFLTFDVFFVFFVFFFWSGGGGGNSLFVCPWLPSHAVPY